MRLYTKTGDQGETGLIGGERVAKDHLRVAAYGDVDELNAFLGWAAAACEDSEWLTAFEATQDRLFVLGAQLANPSSDAPAPAIGVKDVETLEQWIDTACDSLEPLKQFILPGGCELAGRLHVTRAVCRRAERSAVKLARQETVADQAIVFLNRLADLLFAWARLANQRARVTDIIWNPPNAK